MHVWAATAACVAPPVAICFQLGQWAAAECLGLCSSTTHHSHAPAPVCLPITLPITPPAPPPLPPPPTHILRHPNLYTPRTPAPPNTHTPHSHSHQQQPTQDYRQRRVAQERDKQASATADFHALFDGGLSMGELPPGVDIERLDTLLQQLGPELAQELGLRWVGVGRECLMGLLGGGQGRERRVEARRQRSLTGCAVCCCCCVF